MQNERLRLALRAASGGYVDPLHQIHPARTLLMPSCKSSTATTTEPVRPSHTHPNVRANTRVNTHLSRSPHQTTHQEIPSHHCRWRTEPSRRRPFPKAARCAHPRVSHAGSQDHSKPPPSSRDRHQRARFQRRRRLRRVPRIQGSSEARV